MRCNKKRISAALAVCTAAATVVGGFPALAAAPAVSVDESVYVNLDYYGVVKDTSIVKGCDLNGNQSFIDYGAYDKVMNMSNHAQPKLEGDHVAWELESGDGRFYYECKPKNLPDLLPWTIDVSYSLNGAPKKADELAGAAGLVQVDIQVTPNSGAKEYYRNNMCLVAAAMVDLEDVNSFRADGAQMQAVGSRKVALFMAMPGEDTAFSYQIGTDSFESPGTVFLMVPVTMAQLDEVANLKEAKERIEDASDAFNDSLDIVLSSLQALPTGLEQTKNALQTLDQAREMLHESSEGLYQRMDKLHSSLAGVSNTLRKLASKLDDGEGSDLEHISDRLVSSSDSMTGAAKAVSTVNKSLTLLKTSLSSYSTVYNGSLPDEEKKPLLVKYADEVNRNVRLLETNLKKLEASGYTGDMQDQAEQLGALAGTINSGFGGLGDDGDFGAAANIADGVKEPLNDAINQVGQMSGTLTGMSAAGSGVVDEIYDLLDTINASGVVSSTRRVVSATAVSLEQVRNTSTYVESVMKDVEEVLNNGAKELTEGLTTTIDTSINGLNQTGQIRDQKNIIKETIQNEWDRLEDDLGILNIDTQAEKISFTSEKNPVPDSIQIILRTDEISLDDDEGVMEDLETSAQNEGVWHRVTQIFVKIGNAAKSLFE